MAVIHHLGWAVHSIDSARPHFETNLGLDFRGDERFADVRTAFFGSAPTMVELLEPLIQDSDIGQFLSRKGEGLHHLAFLVEDVAAALAEASRHGLKLIDSVPRHGSRGTLVGVVDPGREDGVLVQYVQER